MIISAHQPAYLPWLGYFDKIARADVFVYLDTVQFEKNSFTNRNRIKTPQGEQWLTVPVRTKGHLLTTVHDIAIDDTQPWRSKHLKAIAMNYSRAPRFVRCYPMFEELLGNTSGNLAEMCWRQLRFWLSELGISTTIIRSSELPEMRAKSDLILDICRHLGATHYLSGALGRGYLAEDDFRRAKIAVEYQEYIHPVYRQLWGAFLPNMGIVDSWMNTEPFTLQLGIRRA